MHHTVHADHRAALILGSASNEEASVEEKTDQTGRQTRFGSLRKGAEE